MKNRLTIFTTVLSVLAGVAFLPQMQAQSLPPEIPNAVDGCYPNFGTAEGCDALNGPGPFTGLGNTALGWRSLFFSGPAFWNTGTGAGTLAINTGNENTATGAGALLINLGANNNTADGAFALFQNLTGIDNTAVGQRALFNNDIDAFGLANRNTAVGARAMQANVDGASNIAVGSDSLTLNLFSNQNTAVGDGTLLFNDADGAGAANDNTAVGFRALREGIDAFQNTAVGSGALQNNDFFGGGGASNNTAVGFNALNANIDGDSNTAVGAFALNTENAVGGFPFGVSNNAVGRQALFLNTTGSFNQAMGVNALFTNDSGFGNIAIGDDSMTANVSAAFNTVVGDLAGNNIVAFGGNIYIGVGVPDPTVVPDEVAFIRIGTPTFTDPVVGTVPYDTFIAGIFDRAVDLGTARFVFVDANQKVGTELVDAQGNRFTIPMPQTAPAPARAPEAAKHALLDLKVKELQATVAQQQKQIEALTTGLQKVSAQIEVSKPAPQVVVNKP